MEGQRFDEIARTMVKGSSRRSLLKGIGGLFGIAIGLAKAAKSADALTATGSLDVTRYGRPLKARRLVGVRGAGAAFDGLYYVKSVTHDIKRGQYRQNFTLVRNGLMSTVGSVPA